MGFQMISSGVHPDSRIASIDMEQVFKQLCPGWARRVASFSQGEMDFQRVLRPQSSKMLYHPMFNTHKCAWPSIPLTNSAFRIILPWKAGPMFLRSSPTIPFLQLLEEAAFRWRRSCWKLPSCWKTRWLPSFGRRWGDLLEGPGGWPWLGVDKHGWGRPAFFGGSGLF